MIDEEWEILDRKALGSIWLCLKFFVTFNISKAKTIDELMQTLIKLYENPSALNKVFLMKQLFNTKVVEGGSIKDHLNEFNIVTSQLATRNLSFYEEFQGLLVLCSLLES